MIPAIDVFKPDILLVSAGYDAHARDPLAGMRLTVSGYARLAGLLKDAAGRHCHGRTAWVTEGGYHLDALRRLPGRHNRRAKVKGQPSYCRD